MTAQIELDGDQALAVRMMLDPKVRIGVLTGGPGRGKTTCLRAALAGLHKANKSVALAAPTGKAARRMSEACNYPAQTLHRLLGLGRGESTLAAPTSPEVMADVIIVDEASMLDTELAAALFTAIDPRWQRVFFVGDRHQLPSIGPGYVLGDLIASARVPVVELHTLHRAAAESWIAQNAPRVLAGEQPALEERLDFHFLELPADPAKARAQLLANLEHELQQAAELVGTSTLEATFEECQLLGPMRKGILGVDSLNLAVQSMAQGDYANPRDAFVRDEEVRFWSQDKVLQTKNDYGLDVMNGETGLVVGRTADGKRLLVRIDEREHAYSREAAFQLDLGYMTTIHKSQGSEWPVVLLLCHSTHGRMLSRQLIYTAITRAKRRLVIAGDRKALDMALRNNRVSQRTTGLQRRLAV